MSPNELLDLPILKAFSNLNDAMIILEVIVHLFKLCYLL